MKPMHAFVVGAALLGACGKSDEGAAKKPTPEPAPAPTAAPPPAAAPAAAPAEAPAPAPGAIDESNGYCEVKLEGDVNLTARSPGGSMAVGTDYWMTEAELDQASGMMAGNDPARQKEAKTADPRLYVLLLNCMSPQVNLNLLPGTGTKYKDLPFKPGKYAISRKAGPGQFAVMLSIEDGKGFFSPTSDGTIDITKFDATGIAGTFALEADESFPAEGKPKRKIKASGQFDFKCHSFQGCAK